VLQIKIYFLQGNLHLEIDHMITAHEQKQNKQKISERLANFSLAHTTIEFELPEEVCRDD